MGNFLEVDILVSKKNISVKLDTIYVLIVTIVGA